MNDLDIHPSWAPLVGSEFEKPYFQSLRNFVATEQLAHTIYPPAPQIFAALNETPFENVRVVILGQDPYHGPDQANGLCFSVNDGVQIPPSLRNIFKELQADVHAATPASGNLTPWAQQGVLLINATLTVRAHQAGSHQGQGWEQFTDAVIAKLSAQRAGLVFLLWGKFAQNKAQLVAVDRQHLMLRAAHPSPLSAYNGFFGCKHFSQTNRFLEANGTAPIQWQLP